MGHGGTQVTRYLTRDQLVATLRAAADRIDSDPAFDLGVSWTLDVAAYGLTGEQFAAVAASRGTWTKGFVGTGETTIRLSQEVGDGTVSVFASRGEVCTARETGRTVTRTRYEPVEVEVPEVVWDCEPVLKAGLP